MGDTKRITKTHSLYTVKMFYNYGIYGRWLKTHVALHSSLIGVNWVEVDWILYSSLRFEFVGLLIVCDFVFVYFGSSVSVGFLFCFVFFFFVARYTENKFITSSIKNRIIFWKIYTENISYNQPSKRVGLRGNNDDILVQLHLNKGRHSRQNPIPWNYGKTKVLRNLNKVRIL